MIGISWGNSQPVHFLRAFVLQKVFEVLEFLPFSHL